MALSKDSKKLLPRSGQVQQPYQIQIYIALIYEPRWSRAQLFIYIFLVLMMAVDHHFISDLVSDSLVIHPQTRLHSTHNYGTQRG